MNKNSSINFFTLLFLIFLVLKLTGVIDWSWWWITIPLWGFLALALILYALLWVTTIVIELTKTIRLLIKLWRIKHG